MLDLLFSILVWILNLPIFTFCQPFYSVPPLLSSFYLYDILCYRSLDQTERPTNMFNRVYIHFTQILSFVLMFFYFKTLDMAFGKKIFHFNSIYFISYLILYHFLPGMFLRFFVNLYNMEVIDEDTYLKWKEEVNDTYPGKGKSLFQVYNPAFIPVYTLWSMLSWSMEVMEVCFFKYLFNVLQCITINSLDQSKDDCYS